MKTIAIDENNDWDFGLILSGDNAIKQEVITKLKEWYGDCIFNVSAGLDYNRFLGYNIQNKEATIKQAIRALLMSIAGVNSVMDINFILNNRQAFISAKIIINNSIIDIPVQL